MKHIIGLMAMLLPIICGAQSPPVRALSVGDTVPDIVFNHVINYKDSTAKLSDFKGKLVILDFWATWCSSCISHFAKIDSLQKVYKDRLQVILVTRENKETAQKFFNKRALQAMTYSLPSTVEDTTFNLLFPHRFIPHYVWINANGIISAITDADAITADNINTLFNEEKINVAHKQDVMGYNEKQPLLQDGNGGSSDKLVFSSTLTSYLEGMGSGTRTNDDGINNRFTYINRPILSLYQAALGFSSNRVVVLAKDSTRFFKMLKPDNEWYKNNSYCYEYTMPLTARRESANSNMVNDLNGRFQLYGRMETMKVPCYILIKTNKVKSDDTDHAAFHTSSRKPLIQLLDKPLSVLLQNWNSQIITRPSVPIFLDETGYSGNITLQLYSSVKDLSALKKELQSYGFDLIPATREISLFILSESDHY